MSHLLHTCFITCNFLPLPKIPLIHLPPLLLAIPQRRVLSQRQMLLQAVMSLPLHLLYFPRFPLIHASILLNLSNLILSYLHILSNSKCGIQKPNPLYSLISSSISPIPYDPKSTLLDKNWDCAMTKEFDALIKQTTWDLVPCPLDTNVIGCHWIFCHKIQMGH